jgi:hypothetical protein
MTKSFAFLIFLFLAGCSKSEIDQCVDAKTVQYLAQSFGAARDGSTFEEYKKKNFDAAKSLNGGDFYVECMKAQSGK